MGELGDVELLEELFEVLEAGEGLVEGLGLCGGVEFL